jgi:hypothetical protein
MSAGWRWIAPSHRQDWTGDVAEYGRVVHRKGVETGADRYRHRQARDGRKTGTGNLWDMNGMSAGHKLDGCATGCRLRMGPEQAWNGHGTNFGVEAGQLQDGCTKGMGLAFDSSVMGSDWQGTLWMYIEVAWEGCRMQMGGGLALNVQATCALCAL